MTDPANIGLRIPTVDDEEMLYRLQSDIDTWEERSPAAPTALTLETFRQRRAAAKGGHDVEFVVTLDGQGVGQTTIFHEDPLARTAELGISLLPEARGKGVGTEALRRTIDFALVRRNLRRVHLIVIASNLSAIAVYRKLGFVEEGRRREHCWVRGVYEDEILMGLLRSEWVGGSPMVLTL